MSPSSPTESGDLLEDAHFVLKTDPHNAFSTTLHGVTYEHVQPVTCTATDYDTWRLAPFRKAELSRPLSSILNLLLWHRETFVGRRVNDEVEMFEEGMKYEYAELRRDMQARGLTVRAYVPQAEGAKFPRPGPKAVAGEGEGVTLIKKCHEHLESIIELNYPEGIEHGLLASIPGRKRALAILRVPEEDVDSNTVTITEEITARKVPCPVIGTIADGKVKFSIEEAEVKKFFDSLGRLDTATFQDVVAEKEEREKQAALAEKRKAKKHRRNVVSSSNTFVESEQSSSVGFGGGEDGEAARTRQKAKYADKRKAQKEKRKRQAGSDEANTTTHNCSPAKTNKSDASDDDENKPMTIQNYSTDEHGNLTVEEVTGPVLMVLLAAHNAANSQQENGSSNEETKKVTELGDGDSDAADGRFEDANEDGEKGVEVVTYGTQEEKEAEVAKRAGRSMVEVDKTGVEGLKYLGRGL
ncbi:uncharacterized protein LTR77_000218 [Saxophila tyrrhenica]|uniref:Uncharacterized protein n=1 Tax=Saxophila tyrrhenica TaxID=1690608 RepID=A0AAV9PMR7_9PEZI|nr:hypothetical protein LTR77_000218 [Saxophila tyrrhenica]